MLQVKQVQVYLQEAPQEHWISWVPHTCGWARARALQCTACMRTDRQEKLWASSKLEFTTPGHPPGGEP